MRACYRQLGSLLDPQEKRFALVFIGVTLGLVDLGLDQRRLLLRGFSVKSAIRFYGKIRKVRQVVHTELGLVVFVVVFVDEALDLAGVNRGEDMGSQSQFDLDELLWGKFSKLWIKLKDILATRR